MFGQFLVEPELGLVVLEPPLDDWVVVEEPVPEPEPVLGVEAAPATRAPPATRPEVSAPVASTVRKRNRMGMHTFRLS
jgi:hypothetical protein